MNKEAKKCVEYYIENIQSEMYREYLANSKKEGIKNHKQYVREEKPEWIERTDYYEPDFISSISFFDLLDNQGTTKLLRKLYSLPKKKYRVKNYYKKAGIIKKYDYVHLNYSGSGWGRFAEIEFIDDPYISNISICWCQLSSYYAFFEYNIEFKKVLDEDRYYDFMKHTMASFTNKDYVLWYPSINQIKNGEIDGLLLETMDSEFFPVACQHYITSLLYSENGKHEQLVNMTFCSRKAPIDINTIYFGDISYSYYNKKQNFYISSDLDQINYCLCAGNNIIQHFSVLSLVSMYGNKFYYQFARYAEIKNYEYCFSNLFTGRKRITYGKKYHSFIRKMKSLTNIENRKSNNFVEKFNDNWNFYIANDEQDFEKYVKETNVDFQAIYQENFHYLQIVSEMKYTRISVINSVIATVFSFVAAAVAIIALLN